ncbi:MAG: hypothetical protein HY040_05395 [Planctomycetes bacterium]|nr:hypothetical protein [Planctomycetota bacterium]
MHLALIMLIGIIGSLPAMGWLWPWKNMRADARAVAHVAGSEKLFKLGHFQEATAFLRIAVNSSESRSAAFSHNLGNMYLLADKIPQAVLSYKEGLRLNPNHEPLRANLEYARAQVNYPPSGRGHPESEAWPSWLYQPSPFQAFIAAFVLVAIGSLLFTRWMMLPQSGSLRYSLPFLVLAAAAHGSAPDSTARRLAASSIGVG